MSLKSIFMRVIAVFPIALWQVIFFFAPILFLCYEGYKSKKFLSIPLWLISNGFLKIVLRSFFAAFITALLCLIIGYAFVYTISRQKRIIKNIALIGVCAPFLTNFVIHIAAWISLLENNSFLHNFLFKIGFCNQKAEFLYNFASMILVFVYCYLPFMILPLYTGLGKMNFNLIRAARDLGATELQTFFSVVIPFTQKSIVTGFLMVFIAASSEFLIPQLIGGDKFLYCGTIFSHILLTPSLLSIAPFATFLYILMIGGTSFLLYYGLAFCIKIVKKI